MPQRHRGWQHACLEPAEGACPEPAEGACPDGAAAEAFDIPATPGSDIGLFRWTVEAGDALFEGGVILIAGGGQRGAVAMRRVNDIMADPMMVIAIPMIMPSPMGFTASILDGSVIVPLNEALNAYLRR